MPGADPAADPATAADPLLTAVERSDAGGARAQTVAGGAPPPPQPPLAQQLMQAIRVPPDGPVEIRLSPEELGRVRLTLSVTDGGLSVQIAADRPETLELIRRHLPDLAREFRDIGHSSLAFSFAGSGGEGHHRATTSAPETPIGEPDSPGSPRIGRSEPLLAATDRLDLRL